MPVCVPSLEKSLLPPSWLAVGYAGYVGWLASSQLLTRYLGTYVPSELASIHPQIGHGAPPFFLFSFSRARPNHHLPHSLNSQPEQKARKTWPPFPSMALFARPADQSQLTGTHCTQTHVNGTKKSLSAARHSRSTNLLVPNINDVC